MGKLQLFDITFTDNKLVYGPGESISGTVKIRTSNSLQYKAIKVTCHGSCGISNKLNDASWILEEQYLNSMLSVADKGTLAPGEHSFPFQFLIPEAVPTSFEGPFGKIIYRVRAVIDTPRFTKDYKIQKPFYILNMLNLNKVSGIERPSYAVTTKKFSYLLVKTGTLMLKARTDMRGYIPGQIIKLATEIHNKSGKDTGCVLATLIQKVTYKTKRPLFDLRTIAEVEGAGVKAGKHAEWREQIIVPPLPQSALNGCSLIDIDYCLQVSLKSPETVIILPIYIGNIALNLSLSRSMPSSPDHCGVAPGAAGVAPSAPPAEEEPENGMCAGGIASEEIPTKSHSQQDPSGQQVSMSPSAFSHAPGAALPPSHTSAPIRSDKLRCVCVSINVEFFLETLFSPFVTLCFYLLSLEYIKPKVPNVFAPSSATFCGGTNDTIMN
ncbi:Arrestin domain-containing protein 1 [Channa argus]|uniref:Arrestin domain-containing protein 1 n=1 Tax=Channa argus TaxID=215402 RepID=A0A6G1QIR4_CHAAH|nr:Arrestin domain-containing protein 1 [Channa argus]